MRCAFSFCLLFLTSAALHSQEYPVPYEKANATDWKVLFDGVTLEGFVIKGPHRIEGKVLVVGGDQPAEIRSTLPLGHQFGLYIEYRLRGGGTVRFNTERQDAMSSASKGIYQPHGMLWMRSFYSSIPDDRFRTIRADYRLRDVSGAVWASDIIGHLGDTTAITVAFQIGPGDTLEVATIKVRGQVEGSLLWWAAAGIIAAIAIMFVALLVILRRRRIRIRPPSGAAPGDPTTT